MIRRKFLKRTSILFSSPAILYKLADRPRNRNASGLVISTWNNKVANQAAWDIVEKGGYALDAVEAGARVPEANPMDSSVGYGGRPGADGIVSLDACIMDDKGNAGSVCYLKEIKHPVSVARKVMEKTPHVILAGKGALKFAIEEGFKKENLLTDEAKKAWKEWKKQAKFKPVINVEDHDTIGILALDKKGRASGACTTSGLAFKKPGRVGDSPIIGAGLFVDNEIGGAAATGMGEIVLRNLSTFLVVEFMRQGMKPQLACERAIKRIIHKDRSYKEFQVGLIAVNISGETGAYSIHPGFNYTVSVDGTPMTKKADSFLK